MAVFSSKLNVLNTVARDTLETANQICSVLIGFLTIPCYWNSQKVINPAAPLTLIGLILQAVVRRLLVIKP